MRRIACLLMLVGVVTCAESATGPGGVRGVWTLRTYDDSVVPGKVYGTMSSGIEVLSGSITFDAGRYDIRVTYRNTDDVGVATNVTHSASGGYTTKGSLLIGTPGDPLHQDLGVNVLRLWMSRDTVLYEENGVRLGFVR
jgi:hypothetical protein